MLTVIFNDVGNGDSIILDINQPSSGKRVVGLVDCALAKDALHPKHRNPTLNWLKRQTALSEIEFIILSHPHYDHYSGFAEILQFCLDNSIRVKHFFHTLFLTEAFKFQTNRHATDILKTLIGKAPENISRLNRVFTKLSELHDKGLYDKNSRTSLIRERLGLADNVYLQTIGPTGRELENFIRNKKIISLETLGEKEQSDLVNSLSYVSYIKAYNNSFILFTADCLRETSKRIPEDPFIIMDGNCDKKLIQVPHHGGDSYHAVEFWDHFSAPCLDKRAIISSGSNPSYQHPSKRVVDYIISNGFRIHSTNHVFGLSHLTRSLETQGEQVFNFS